MRNTASRVTTLCELWDVLSNPKELLEDSCRSLLEVLARLTPCDRAAIALYRSNEQSVWTALCHCDPQDLSSYLQGGYRAVDSLALELSRGQTVAVLNNSHRKKNSYAAFLIGIKVYHEVRMLLRNDNEMLGFISLKRCSEDKYYTPEELGSLRSLSVLMSKLVYPLWAIGCSLPLKGLELALESCNVGIIMCDSNLQILFSNRHAEEICRVLETSPNPVKAFVKRVSARLRSGFTAAVVSASGDLFTLRAFCEEDLGQPGISLLCMYPETGPAAEDGANAVTSLTPREREIVGLLSQGLSTREIARLLWISEHTVKVHLKHIYRKAGVTSRAQLLGKLIHTRSSPAVLVVSR